jgi:capsular exopolysaccharide synthesis family protein
LIPEHSPRGYRQNRDLFASFAIDSPYVTEVRRLLQSLARRGREGDQKTYLITSASRGEGKSTICGLLAVVAAKIFRRRVLVMDGDFRRPSLHHLLGIPQRPGLCDVLQHRVTVDVAIRPTPLPTLLALPSGSPQGPLAVAFDEEEFHRLIQSLRPDFDLIFVDSAPVVPVVEPLLMAEHLDGILIVAMAGKSQLNLVRRMRQILAPVSGRVAGVILNNATEGLPYYYDYRYYGYEAVTHRRIRVRKQAGGVTRTEREEPEHPAP